MGRTFNTLSLDANLPRSFAGSIYSVFPRAFNIRTGENELISIVAAEKLNGPNRILLKLSGEGDFISLGLRRGMEVIGTRQEINVDGESFLILLAAADSWYSAIEIDGVTASWRVKDNLSFLQEFLYLEGGDNRISQELRVRGQDLIKSIERRNFAEISGRIKKLIGFGEGLTPSGDDFLTGLIASLLLVNNAGFGYLVRSVKEVIGLEKERTTFLSGKFLEYACQGRFPEVILNLIEAIFAKGREEVEKAARRCLDFGASSGRDTLLGILFGLSLGARRGLKRKSVPSALAGGGNYPFREGPSGF